jgi:hypothetical protein
MPDPRQPDSLGGEHAGHHQRWPEKMKALSFEMHVPRPLRGRKGISVGGEIKESESPPCLRERKGSQK